MNATDQLLQNNEGFVSGFDSGDLAAPPGLKVAIVTCMDARLDPARALGLSLGDAHVIRNAGGVVTDDVLRSLAISQHELGTEEVIIMHHTRCGMIGVDDEQFARRLEEETGQRPEWTAHGFADLEEDVRAGVQRVLSDPFLPRKDSVRGFVYEVETGRVREVN
jgi:carbonic anhydrase